MITYQPINISSQVFASRVPINCEKLMLITFTDYFLKVLYRVSFSFT